MGMNIEIEPKKGLSKVYRKNLLKILNNLGQIDLFKHKTQFHNLLIQAEDCLIKLKKTNAKVQAVELENEYNYFKDQYLKATNGL